MHLAAFGIFKTGTEIVHSTAMKFIALILMAFTIVSCHSNAEKVNKPAPQKKVAVSKVIQSAAIKAQPEKHELMEFVEYNDEGDYYLLTARKGDSILSLLNTDSDDRSLLRGDLIDVFRKTVEIEMAGDGDAKVAAEQIISMVKVKDGKVAKFRRQYGKKLKYTWPEEEQYSQYYLDKLYALVEYYIANSKNDLLRLNVKNREQLTYSIEKQTKDNKEYMMIGIATVSEHHVNTIQWLYLVQEENDTLYEYDLAQDRLIRFD